MWLGGLALPVGMGMVACGPTVGEIANADDGDDESSSGDPDDDDDDDDDDSTVSLTTDSPGTTDSPTEPMDTSTTGEIPTSCGDAIVDDGEECDDGNADAADGCEVDCRHSPGTILWSQSIDGDANVADFGAAVVVDGAGTIHAVGSLQQGAGYDAWYAAFDPDGNLVRESAYDLGGDEFAQDVVVDETGAVFVTMSDGSSARVLRAAEAGLVEVGAPMPHDLPFAVLAVAAPGGGVITVRGITELDDVDGYGYVLEAHDGMGAIGWSAADNPDVIVRAMTTTADGGIVLAGGKQNMANHEQMWAREVTTAGTAVWTYDDDLVDYEDESIATVVVTADGRVLAAGQREIPGYGQLPYVAELTEGQLVDIHDVSVGDAQLWIHAILDDGDGIVLGGVGYPDQTPSDAVVAAFDHEGTLRWGTSYDDALGFNDSVRGLARDPVNGDLIAIGTDVASGEADNVWLARLRG